MTAPERNETNPEQNAAQGEARAVVEAPSALRRLVLLGGVAYAGALAAPAACFLAASAEGAASSGGARWIRVGAPRRDPGGRAPSRPDHRGPA